MGRGLQNLQKSCIEAASVIPGDRYAYLLTGQYALDETDLAFDPDQPGSTVNDTLNQDIVFSTGNCLRKCL